MAKAMSKQQAEAFWAAHDKNNDGVLSADECKAGLKGKMSDDGTEALFKDLGLDSGSNVTKEAFMAAFTKRRKEVLREVFSRMDKDGNGKLNGQEVLAIIMSEKLYNKEDLDALFTKVKDTDGDDSVNAEEFIAAAF